MHQSLTDTGIDLNCIAQCSLPKTPPWLLCRPKFDSTLFSLGNKSDTSPDLYLSYYKELVSRYPSYKKVFTDGSKTGRAVSAAAVNKGTVLVSRLPDHASILPLYSQQNREQFSLHSTSLNNLLVNFFSFYLILYLA